MPVDDKDARMLQQDVYQKRQGKAKPETSVYGGQAFTMR